MDSAKWLSAANPDDLHSSSEPTREKKNDFHKSSSELYTQAVTHVYIGRKGGKEQGREGRRREGGRGREGRKPVCL